MTEPAREWIIQRCISALRDEYENWPGFDQPMTRAAMQAALQECHERWPNDEFRGHNVRNAQRRPGAEVAYYS